MSLDNSFSLNHSIPWMYEKGNMTLTFVDALRDRTEVEDDRIGDDNEAGLLSNLGPYDQDDVEADKIYAGIDDKLDERRRSRREAREADELQQYRKSRPKIQQQFEDLKRSMKDVTEEEWMNIPEVGDYRAKKMKKAPSAKERYTPVPDSIIEHSMRGTEYVTSLDGHDSVRHSSRIHAAV